MFMELPRLREAEPSPFVVAAPQANLSVAMDVHAHQQTHTNHYGQQRRSAIRDKR